MEDRRRQEATRLMEDRRRQEVTQEEVLSFSRQQQSCDRKSSWLLSSERHFLSGDVQRTIRDTMTQQEVLLDQRRDR